MKIAEAGADAPGEKLAKIHWWNPLFVHQQWKDKQPKRKKGRLP